MALISTGILARRCREVLGGSTSTETEGNSGSHSEEGKQQKIMNHSQALVLSCTSSGILHIKYTYTPSYVMRPSLVCLTVPVSVLVPVPLSRAPLSLGQEQMIQV